MNLIHMKQMLLKTMKTPKLKAVPDAGPVLAYTGMYIKVNNWQKNDKPSPFKVQYQTGSLAKESANWDSEWFAHYE
jgi:hypothetical protein